MFRNPAEPPASRTRFPDREKTSAEPTAAAVTFQCWGKEGNGRQSPQPFWKTSFDHLKHKVAAPATSLLPRGSCSSFFISITQYPGSLKLLTGRTKAQTTLQCLLRSRFNTSHVDYPSLAASHSLTSQAGRVRGNKITQMSLKQPSRTEGLLTTAPTGITFQNTATETLQQTLKISLKAQQQKFSCKEISDTQATSILRWSGGIIRIYKFFSLYSQPQRRSVPPHFPQDKNH